MNDALGQTEPQTTPLIPQANPSPTPEKPTELPQPQGGVNETQPLIPPGQLPTPIPGPTPGGSPGANQVVGGLTQQQAAEFDQKFDAALSAIHEMPPGMVPIGLLEAVRIGLSRNKDLRLSIEGTQSARGKLKQAVGAFDTTAKAVAKYAYSIPGQGSNANLNNDQEVLTQALPPIFRAAGLPVSNSTVSTAVTQAIQNQANKPTETIDTSIAIDKKLRNGVDIGFEYQPIWTDEAGNLKYPPTTNQFKLTANIPLFKKAGVLYNSVDEITARIDYEAKLMELRNDAQKTALTVAQAYWAMVAAVDKLALQDRAYRVSSLLRDLSQQMAEGGAVPYSEVTLAEGRRSQAFAQRVQALVAVYNAARTLGITIGLRSDELRSLPFAGRDFPNFDARGLSALKIDNLVDIALARRTDRTAALDTIKSKRVSLDKAQADLTIAPELTAGLGTDINNQKLQLSNGKFQRGTRTGLDASISAQLGWPFANNIGEGGVMMAQSDLNSAIINMEDLSSTIAANVTASMDTLDELANDVSSQVKAVNAFRKSFADMREKFRRGATTMFETIQSEEQLTTAETELVDFRLALANALVQLRYETATLLSSETTIRTPGFPNGVEQAFITEKAFETVPDVSQPVGPNLKDRNYEPNIKYISG
ncbi:MAG: TolC family protein, partial [Verrucomicrobia bacterium]|nr:TolC family protein [Verrucomicrobiota bacterium]